MDLNQLKHAEGAVKKGKRKGRGPGTGNGKTAGRGHKGQRSRSGSKTRSWFEGGQMPLQRRVPKRGFTNIFQMRYEIVNVGQLDKIKEKQISPDLLYARRMIRKKDGPVKILGDGEITQAVEVHAHAFSKSAIAKLEKAGGKVIKL